MTARIPLHVLTGFLGSGKTTLLNRLLRDPAWIDSAVLINEIGAVSIDHDLVERIESGDSLDIVVLKGGCTCCELRGDMGAALRELYARRAEGRVPPFARVVIETTGLADPAPVLFTLAADPALRHKFERGVVVTAVDAVHGLAQLACHPEARKQIAAADRVVLTKTDLNGAAPRDKLVDAISRLNPAATVDDAHNLTTDSLLERVSDEISLLNRAYGNHKAERRSSNALRSMAQDRPTARPAENLGGRRPELGQRNFVADAPQAEHSADIASVAIMLDRPIEWSAFAVWLSLLVHAHGQKLLRFKALLDVAGWPGPVALDAIHHMVHPPRHLPAWPVGPRLSRLVFIAQGLEMERIEPSLRTFLAGMSEPASASPPAHEKPIASRVS